MPLFAPGHAGLLFLCLRRAPWLDRKRTNADPHYINAELRTVSYQASPEGQQLGQRLV